MSNAEYEFESHLQRRWSRLGRWALLLAALLAATFLGAYGCGLVGLHYMRAVDNDPLVAPVRVLSVQKSTLRLEDGRALQVDHLLRHDVPLRELIEASGNWVDVEPDGPQTLIVFVKTRRGICGTPWAQPVSIPLIPDNVPVNRREQIGTAKDKTDRTIKK
jgi:hypothetical protein